ncbi:CYTH domain-containing protein [Selenomonas sp. TAMA-11512]|uniref:CYTH domain-containing protein n=1 Tax=Selenomonas sp. TAMA-11512 TaxID=3095337 RepID=UPI00308ED6E8|nr:CYTH domain-containing protein [Selenomonas sp. TAMA-11512]
MAKEIERKFLVKSHWRPETEGLRIVQGYLSTADSPVVRVRIYGDKGYLTVKGKTEGISRSEYEYEIPLRDAEEMLRLCPEPPVEKIRHRIPLDGHTFEVDVFHGANEGLVLAEVELSSPDEPFTRPDWIGKEVSADSHYYNSNLAKHPFTKWQTARANI